MSSIRFYHYLSEKDLAVARRTGITKGIVPMSTEVDRDNVKKTKLNFLRFYQWLTKNPNFIPLDAPGDVGPKNTTLLPNRRAEYRVRVTVPGDYRGSLIRWTDFRVWQKQALTLTKEIESDLLNPEEWILFGGVILPAWIDKPVRNPAMPRTTVDLGT